MDLKALLLQKQFLSSSFVCFLFIYQSRKIIQLGHPLGTLSYSLLSINWTDIKLTTTFLKRSWGGRVHPQFTLRFFFYLSLQNYFSNLFCRFLDKYQLFVPINILIVSIYVLYLIGTSSNKISVSKIVKTFHFSSM